MNNKIINLNGKDYIVTDMIVIDKGFKTFKYNIFDLKYKHVVTIDAENEIEFLEKFNNYLKENKI